MGFSMFSLDIPTTKTSSSLLCLAEDEVAKAEPSPCINCGRCVEACPEQLIPSRLAKMADHGVADEFEKMAWTGMYRVRKLQLRMSCKTSVGTVHQDHEKTGSCSKEKEKNKQTIKRVFIRFYCEKKYEERGGSRE